MNGLAGWYRTTLGRHLAALERQAVSRVLERVFGYHLIQLGGFGDHEPLPKVGLVKQWVVDSNPKSGGDVRAVGDELPFTDESADVVVIVHTLEFSASPHQVLREAERVLAPEGRLVIVGFNPLSLWGLRRALSLLGRSRRPPWAGHYFTMHRIRDWCDLLGLEPLATEHVFFRPPVQNRRLQARLRAVERVGQRLWPWLGGSYVMSSRKRVARLIPMEPAWKSSKQVVPGRLAQPSARGTLAVRRDGR